MPEKKSIIINTTPILTLIAACRNLDFLENMYEKVIVPLEVRDEILKGGKYGFGVNEFINSKFIHISNSYIKIPDILSEFLDSGEASVIATALESIIPYEKQQYRIDWTDSQSLTGKGKKYERTHH